MRPVVAVLVGVCLLVVACKVTECRVAAPLQRPDASSSAEPCSTLKNASGCRVRRDCGWCGGDNNGKCYDHKKATCCTANPMPWTPITICDNSTTRCCPGAFGKCCSGNQTCCEGMGLCCPAGSSCCHASTDLCCAPATHCCITSSGQGVCCPLEKHCGLYGCS